MRSTSDKKVLQRKSGPGSPRKSELPVATVLHIDDDPNDAELLRAATLKAGVPFLLLNVDNGDQAIAYLSGVDRFADRSRYPLPALILLDLKMPCANGFEVLNWIRSHCKLHQVPVVVLSGSELQDDIRQAYAGGANSYFVKPIGFAALVNLVRNINTFWLSASDQPSLWQHAPSGGPASSSAA